MDNKKYVWYASYGSNLSRDRFLCYIQGGKPKESLKVEVGCRDKTLPIDDRTVKIPYELYFAKYSGRWKGAVCFLDLIKLEDSSRKQTLGRMYLITEEQFMDVVSQENDGQDIKINLNEVSLKGSKVIESSWYGNIVYLGQCDSYPIFTFTAPWEMDKEIFKKPTGEYLRNLSHGLRNKYYLRDEEIAEYLYEKNGIKDTYSFEELVNVIEGK